jgi:hypothetical protein
MHRPVCPTFTYLSRACISFHVSESSSDHGAGSCAEHLRVQKGRWHKASELGIIGRENEIADRLMGITVFAARKERPTLGPGRSSADADLEAGSVQGRGASISGTPPILGKSFSTSAGNFSTICEILDLPNRVNEFDSEMVIQACDAALLDLDIVLCRLKIGLVDREFYARQLMEIRDIAIAGLSQGANRICASY